MWIKDKHHAITLCLGPPPFVRASLAFRERTGPDVQSALPS